LRCGIRLQSTAGLPRPVSQLQTVMNNRNRPLAFATDLDQDALYQAYVDSSPRSPRRDEGKSLRLPRIQLRGVSALDSARCSRRSRSRKYKLAAVASPATLLLGFSAVELS
jgi:hypothetical protein